MSCCVCLCVVCGLVVVALLWLICLGYVLVIVVLLVSLFVGLGYRFVVCFDGLRCLFFVVVSTGLC